MQALMTPPPPLPARWIDSHCHLDAAEFSADRAAVVARARAAGVGQLVLPAVTLASGEAVATLAHEHGLSYGLGMHPLHVHQQPADAVARLDAQLHTRRDDPRLVAVGEIGIDGFVPGLDPALQQRRYADQLGLARSHGLPVILHVRRSADLLLKHLRRIRVTGGIAHAFNGSEQQAGAFVDLGFRLGFGGALCFERALQIRRLAASLPPEALVLETDAPDIPPPWLYRSAERRTAGEPHGRNEPAELPAIGAALAELRGLTPAALAELATRNTLAALPRLAALIQATAAAPAPAAPAAPAEATPGSLTPHLLSCESLS
jgi:TatD DNase family protein